VRVFHQENGKLVDRTREAGLSGSNGWWNSVDAIDLRGNGRQDLVLGNLGLNSYLRATSKEPVRMYVGDFSHTGGGNVEQIVTAYRDRVSYPIAGRDELLARIPSLRAKFPTYKDFGASRDERGVGEGRHVVAPGVGQGGTGGAVQTHRRQPAEASEPAASTDEQAKAGQQPVEQRRQADDAELLEGRCEERIPGVLLADPPPVA
jgi:hypothetical protein